MKKNRVPKRIWTLAMVLLLLFGLLGCGDPAVDSSEGASSSSAADSTGGSSVEPGDTTEDSRASGTESEDEDGDGTSTGTKKPGDTGSTTTKAVNPPAPSSTTKANATTTGTTKNNTTPKLSDFKKHDITFLFHGLSIDKYGFSTEADEIFSTDAVNYAYCSDLSTLHKYKEYNVKVFYRGGVQSIYEKIKNGNANWRSDYDKLNQSIIDSGYDDTVVGWYIDEPINMPAVYELTKYNAEKFGRRFYICFQVAQLPYKSPGYVGESDSLISKKWTAYLTDIAYDLYQDVNSTVYTGMYDDCNAAIHANISDNTRVWYVGMAYASYTAAKSGTEALKKRQETCIAHINKMYEYLKAEKNPGGLAIWCMNFDSAKEEIYGMANINRNHNGVWNDLLNRCLSIGREISTGRSGIKKK